MKLSASVSAPAVSVTATTTIGEAAGVRDARGVGCRRLGGMPTVDDLPVDVFRRVADLLGPVSCSVLPAGPRSDVLAPTEAVR
ncbi:hypothetical protein [Streptomyces sp. NPDC001389]|uniref:hypothetical protein n=1 Tax=unclassified Streptomyces TaxID=2593676 RepID=UPI00369EA250